MRLALRDAARSLVRHPAFSLPALLVLALSLGALATLVAAVNALLVRPAPYPRPAELVAVFETLRPGRTARLPVSAPRWTAVQARADLFAESAALARGEAGLDLLDRAARVRVTRATASLFPLLGATFAHGQPFAPGDEAPGAPRVAVVAYELFARVLRGDAAALGSRLVLDGVPHRVVGVLAPGFAPHFPADVWTPLSLTPDQRAADRARQGMLTVLARLGPGLDAAAVQGRLAEEAQRARELDPEARGLSVVALSQLLGGELGEALWLLLGAVGVLLLIAIADVANLLLVRAAERQREFAIRLALGAPRRHLVARVLTEGLLVALGAAAVSLLVALWAIEGLTPVATELARAAGIDVDPAVAVLTLGAALLSGLLAAGAPAILGTRAPPAFALNLGLRSRGAVGRRRVRHALVLVELALALVLAFAALVSLRDFSRLLATDPGFVAQDVLAVRVALPPTVAGGPAQARFIEELCGRLGLLPQVEAVGFVGATPLADTSPWDFDVEGPQRRGQGHVIELLQISSPGSLEALGVPLQQGRPFTSADAAGTPRVALVNAAMARRYWPGEDAVGKRVRPWRLHFEDAFSRPFWPDPAAPPGVGPERDAGPEWFTIVGVVGDVRQVRLQQPARPEVWLPLAQFPIPVGALVVRAKGGLTPQLLPAVQAAARAVDRDLALGSSDALSRLVTRSASAERDAVLLLSLFALLALVLAGFGLGGAVASALAERRRELGIRLALGAPASGVVWLLVSLGLRLALAGIALGWLVAWLVTGPAAAPLAQRLPFDPALCGIASLVLLVVALLAAWLPARRAARLSPTLVLQHE